MKRRRKPLLHLEGEYAIPEEIYLVLLDESDVILTAARLTGSVMCSGTCGLCALPGR